MSRNTLSYFSFGMKNVITSRAACFLQFPYHKKRGNYSCDTWRMCHVNSTTCMPLLVSVTEISVEIGNEGKPIKQSVEVSLVLIKLKKNTTYESLGKVENSVTVGACFNA